MTKEQKQQIQKEVIAQVSFSSQVKVANKAGVSNAIISQMINNKWDSIADEMWRKVKIKLRIELDWITAETNNLKQLINFLTEAQKQGISFAVSDSAGVGKSEAYKLYAKLNRNVIYVECKTYWNTKDYIKALVTACGLDDYGTTKKLADTFTDYLAGLENPIVIIDQIDKLKDGSMDYFIDLYNDLSNHCAFCLSGVHAFEKRMRRGESRDKTGYAEIWSRIGKKFVKLNRLTIDDVRSICHANGVMDEKEIDDIFFKSDNDLRRVKKDIQNYFIKKRIKNAS
ncbi:AAA family ATPase [Flavobacterium columnare]|uniref:AAA family ATPase n=1 Tax=Flavobacterium columnare TaxID=996 RepID=UPI0013D84C05|nr:AAA family ATPase [Flavobacterium columnare]